MLIMIYENSVFLIGQSVYGTVFPRFRLGASDLQFVSHFKYLGHIITHNLSDGNDIQREI